MNKVMEYQNLAHALKYFRKQVSVGIPWAIQELPQLNSPKAVWNYLKPRTRYKNDPKGVELFQKIQTLLTDNNFHGIVGAGDCDCFTITALSALIANGFTDCGIVLAGRNRLYPVHIWAYVNDEGREYNFDLTNRNFDQTRPYRYTQKVPYKINQEEKNMLLQLAEGGSSQGEATRPPQYVWLASKGVYQRADCFDNMSAGQFQTMCLSEGLPLSEVEALSKGRAERKAQKEIKKDNRTQRKIEKKAAKPRNVKKVIKAESKASARTTKAESKAYKRTSNADTRNLRVQKKNFMTGAERAATVGNIVQGASNITGSIFNTNQVPDQQNVPEYNYNPYVLPTVPEQEVVYVEAEEIPNDSEEMGESLTWMLIKANKKPLLIGLGLITLFGVGTYVASKMKRKRRMRLAS